MKEWGVLDSVLKNSVGYSVDNLLQSLTVALQEDALAFKERADVFILGRSAFDGRLDPLVWVIRENCCGLDRSRRGPCLPRGPVPHGVPLPEPERLFPRSKKSLKMTSIRDDSQ